MSPRQGVPRGVFVRDGMIGPDTLSIHLYNELIKGFNETPAPPGSFLAQLQREGAPD